MSLPGKRALVVALTLLAVLAVGAGCGEEEHKSEVPEGEPVELGEVAYNVQITRFLNASDPEDREYLQGQQVPPPNSEDSYLAVFIEVENKGDEDATLPTEADLHVVDTTEQKFAPLAPTNNFMLELGARVGAGEELPQPDTAAASGSTQGLIILFLVPADIGENRPLELDIGAGGEEGRIELDI
jgi:hypothetical protein